MINIKLALEKAVKKVCADIYNERVDYFNIVSLKIFNLMKEKNALYLFNNVTLYVEDNGKVYKYNNENVELENETSIRQLKN